MPEWSMEIRRGGGMCGMSGMRGGMPRMTLRHHRASSSCLLTNIKTPQATQNTDDTLEKRKTLHSIQNYVNGKRTDTDSV